MEPPSDSQFSWNDPKPATRKSVEATKAVGNFEKFDFSEIQVTQRSSNRSSSRKPRYSGNLDYIIRDKSKDAATNSEL